MLAIAPLVAFPILLLIALAVRSAGDSRILNVVDYSRVPSPAALHRWVGNRLLVLPILALLTGIVAWQFPSLGLALLLAFVATGRSG